MNGSEYNLVENAIFSSYLELYESLERYQKEYKVIMSRSNSRLINRDGINEELVYLEISYKCKKSGIYKPKGRGIRKANSTKTNCPAFIEVRLSKNRQFLEITNICLIHNHTEMSLTGHTDKSQAENSGGSEPRVVEQTDTTEGPISEQCNLPKDKTAGRITPSDERDALDSSMPCQITDLLELTYAAEVLFEEALKPDACVETLTDLVTSVTDLSIEENTQEHLKNSEEPITITSEVSNQNNADVFLTALATDVQSTKTEATVSKYTVSDSSTGKTVQATSLEDIALPITKSKGRPRGRALMAIGLPIKKEPVSFVAQRPVVQARMILRWLISDERIIQNALTGEYVIGEGDLPQKHEDLPDSIVASEVDLSVLTQYMTKTAFRKLNKIVQKRKDSSTWNCRSCNGNLSEFSILCDSCLCWYDYRCVNLKRAPKTKQWFCPSCKQ